jgi:hypothetical protein
MTDIEGILDIEYHYGIGIETRYVEIVGGFIDTDSPWSLAHRYGIHHKIIQGIYNQNPVAVKIAHIHIVCVIVDTDSIGTTSHVDDRSDLCRVTINSHHVAALGVGHIDHAVFTVNTDGTWIKGIALGRGQPDGIHDGDLSANRGRDEKQQRHDAGEKN